MPLLPRPPAAWVVVGGGANNPTLMRMLRERLAPVKVETAAARGWQGDSIEAQAFAFLAIRSLKGLAADLSANHRRARTADGGRARETVSSCNCMKLDDCMQMHLV